MRTIWQSLLFLSVAAMMLGCQSKLKPLSNSAGQALSAGLDSRSSSLVSGASVSIQAPSGEYLTTANGNIIVSDNSVTNNSTFVMTDITNPNAPYNADQIYLQASNGQYFTIDSSGNLVANSSTPYAFTLLKVQDSTSSSGLGIVSGDTIYFQTPAGTQCGPVSTATGAQVSCTGTWPDSSEFMKINAAQVVLTPSASGTTIPSASQIVDSSENVWTVSSGIVYENGSAAGYTANVTLLLYYNGVIYQENSAGGWWSWNGSGWDNSSDPRPPAVPTPSASGTTIPSASQIVDSSENVWTLSSGVVYENGSAAGYTANVTLLLYYNGVIYQENSAGGWWSWNGSGWDNSSDPRPAPAPATSGNFSVSTSGFTDPNGISFNPRGLNATVQDALAGFGNVFNDYPGLNFIRLNCDPTNDSTSDISQVVQEYTAKGVVVEVEDHADSDSGDNVAWYQQMAQMFANNPYVFLETPNEPSDPNTPQYQIQIIQAIRAAGFSNPIGIQPMGGYDFSYVGQVVSSSGATNLYVTPHIYYNGTDPNGPANYVQSDLADASNLGLFSIIDEFGDAMDGYTLDPYGPEVITSVISANQAGEAGACFWAMDNGNHPDGADSAFLTPDGSQLTPDGVQLQSWLN